MYRNGPICRIRGAKIRQFIETAISIPLKRHRNRAKTNIFTLI